jgi:hypothetical protein
LLHVEHRSHPFVGLGWIQSSPLQQGMMSQIAGTIESSSVLFCLIKIDDNDCPGHRTVATIDFDFDEQC